MSENDSSSSQPGKCFEAPEAMAMKLAESSARTLPTVLKGDGKNYEHWHTHALDFFGRYGMREAAEEKYDSFKPGATQGAHSAMTMLIRSSVHETLYSALSDPKMTAFDMMQALKRKFATDRMTTVRRKAKNFHELVGDRPSPSELEEIITRLAAVYDDLKSASAEMRSYEYQRYPDNLLMDVIAGWFPADTVNSFLKDRVNCDYATNMGEPLQLVHDYGRGQN